MTSGVSFIARSMGPARVSRAQVARLRRRRATRGGPADVRCRTVRDQCYTDRVPTTKPRYTFTDAGDLNELLDAAARRWPEITDRKELLLRLAREGHDALQLGELSRSAEDRRERARAALERIPALVDADLLLSDRAWG